MFFRRKKDFTNTENLFQLYFDIRYFLVISEALDERYRICGSYTERGEFCLTLKCMDPSHMLKEYLDKVKSAVFFQRYASSRKILYAAAWSK